WTVLSRTNRYPALQRANDGIRVRIRRAGRDVDPSVRLSNQPSNNLIILKSGVRIEGARRAQIDAARIGGELKCGRPVQASVAGQHPETGVVCGSWGQQNIVLSGEGICVRTLDLVEVTPVCPHRNPVGVRTIEVPGWAVVAVISDHFKVVQQLLA